MKQNWWKILAVVLLTYSIYLGMMGEVPRRAILNESIRNLYFHVPMWFAMILMLLVSAYHAIKYLQTNEIKHDIITSEFINTAIVLGVLGCLTGACWARVTWGDWWPNDAKLDGVAVGMLMYLAYNVLRGSLDDEQKKARISAVFNIFAFVIFIAFTIVRPRLTDSLHPGNGGNPAFGQYDMNSQMRIVFYPAVVGWMLLGIWITSLRIRLKKLEERHYK